MSDKLGKVLEYVKENGRYYYHFDGSKPEIFFDSDLLRKILGSMVGTPAAYYLLTQEDFAYDVAVVFTKLIFAYHGWLTARQIYKSVSDILREALSLVLREKPLPAALPVINGRVQSRRKRSRKRSKSKR